MTGGMAFAGGPLNNYVLQSTARMAEVLRADPGSRGLVTSVSGFLNKQGFGVWSTRPREGGFAFEDCTAEVARRGGERALVSDAEGEARIASYTVVFHGEAPLEGLAVCDLPGDRRTLAVCRDPHVLAAMTREEFCGRPATLARDGRLTPR